MDNRKPDHDGLYRKMVADVVQALSTGIRVLPSSSSFRFRTSDTEALAEATFLGTIDYDDVEQTDVPPIDVRPQSWPTSDITYLLQTGGELGLIWLRLVAEALRIYVFSYADSRPCLIAPSEMLFDGSFKPLIQIVGDYPGADEMVANATRCALDGAMIMLARANAAGR